MSYRDHLEEATKLLSIAKEHDGNGNVEQAVTFYEASLRSLVTIVALENDDRKRKLLEVRVNIPDLYSYSDANDVG